MARNRFIAAVGSLMFFLVAPVVVAGLIPWWMTGWQARDVPLILQVLGGILIAVGLAALVYSFARFVSEGTGTPAPVAPTQHLVLGGLYRYVRNPMYVAVLAIVVGEGVFLGRSVVFVYALVVGTAMVSFARWYEEPALARRFGESYELYRRNVPGWLPRLTPWRQDAEVQ